MIQRNFGLTTALPPKPFYSFIWSLANLIWARTWDCGPNFLQNITNLLLCNSGLILYLSHVRPYHMRQDPAWSSELRVIIRLFIFLPFSYNCPNSCHLHTKHLADGLVTHSNLKQVYHLVPDILLQLSNFPHIGWNEKNRIRRQEID